MTREVITAGPETPLREIANLMEKHSIKRHDLAPNSRSAIQSPAGILSTVRNLGVGISHEV
jgi:hypothetical protein